MSGFDHLAHLRFALDCLRDSASTDTAIDVASAALRAKAAAAGHPEKYHHTITVFWMRMLARLLDTELPLQYYSRDRLFSDAARAGWLEPDLKPDFNDAAQTRAPDPPRNTPDRAVPR